MIHILMFNYSRPSPLAYSVKQKNKMSPLYHEANCPLRSSLTSYVSKNNVIIASPDGRYVAGRARDAGGTSDDLPVEVVV